MSHFMVGLLIGAALGGIYGWIYAHHTVAEECEKLGAFYVGDRVYRCTSIESKEQS